MMLLFVKQRKSFFDSLSSSFGRKVAVAFFRQSLTHRLLGGKGGRLLSTVSSSLGGKWVTVAGFSCKFCTLTINDVFVNF